MAVTDRFSQAFSNKDNEVKKEPAKPLTPSPTVVQSKPAPTSVRPDAPPPQRKAKVVSYDEDIPTSVKQIAREDVPISTYGIAPTQTNFGLYDEDMDDWLTSFSKKNQRRGGCAITKSQLIHIILDVAFYDMDITPLGYESHEALREDIQQRLKGR